MKREVHIHIYVDDESPARSSSAMGNYNDPDNHYIEVYRDSVADAPMPVVLAHELGHVIARIFDTPANENDIRNVAARIGNSRMLHFLEQTIGLSSDMWASEYTAESEAWDFARKMRPLDEKSAKADLDTYAPDPHD